MAVVGRAPGSTGGCWRRLENDPKRNALSGGRVFGKCTERQRGLAECTRGGGGGLALHNANAQCRGDPPPSVHQLKQGDVFPLLPINPLALLLPLLPMTPMPPRLPMTPLAPLLPVDLAPVHLALSLKQPMQNLARGEAALFLQRGLLHFFTLAFALAAG